jgi:hypothetical protein
MDVKAIVSPAIAFVIPSENPSVIALSAALFDHRG